MTDYRTLIDAETWAFIERSDSFYASQGEDPSIEERRQTYDRLCRDFHAGYPGGIAARDDGIGATGGTIPARFYRSLFAEPVASILYFHGGGFVLGGLESHDDICAELCADAGCEVVSVDYRLAPEHPHPAAFDDAMAAFDWSAETSDLPIILAGDSAGGNLAAAVAHHTRGIRRAPVGQLLIYPALGGDHTKGSYVTHGDAPLLTGADMAEYARMRSGGADFSNDPRHSPLSDRDFARLPPTVIFTAECDPLASDGVAYRDRIVAAGGKAMLFEEKGLVHGYLRARHSVERARASFARIVDAARALAAGDWDG